MLLGIFIEIVGYWTMRTRGKKIEKIYIVLQILNKGSSGNHWVLAVIFKISWLNKIYLLKQFQNVLLVDPKFKSS